MHRKEEIKSKLTFARIMIAEKSVQHQYRVEKSKTLLNGQIG